MDNSKDIFKDYHDPNGYRIRCGYYYPVYRKEYGGHIFYKMPAGNIMVNGEKVPVYKNVSFRNKEKDCNIADGTIIKPLALYESGFFKKDDTYNVIWTIIITDWETKLTAEQQKDEALNEYHQSINVEGIDFNDELPF